MTKQGKGNPLDKSYPQRMRNKTPGIPVLQYFSQVKARLVNAFLPTEGTKTYTYTLAF